MSGDDLNFANPNDGSALYCAIDYAHPNPRRGADPNLQSPILLSALHADEEITAMLIAKGADVNVFGRREIDRPRCWCFSALHLAVKRFFNEEKTPDSSYPDTDVAREILEKRKKVVRLLVIRIFYFKFWLFEINFGRILMDFCEC